MQHDFSEVFETDNELWQRVLEIFERNEKYDKKVVSNRNLHHKYPRSFSKRKGEPVDNDKDNLISLSLADHFLVHYYYYLLAKKGYRQAMATAFTFMAKKGLKYLTPETAEAMAKDYAEAKAISDQYTHTEESNISRSIKVSEAKLELYKDPEERRKNSEMKLGKPHPHKWGQRSEEQISDLRERARKMGQDKATDFGRAYFERYHIGSKDNRKLYQRERTYYKKYGRYSWDDGKDLTKNSVRNSEG